MLLAAISWQRCWANFFAVSIVCGIVSRIRFVFCLKCYACICDVFYGKNGYVLRNYESDILNIIDIKDKVYLFFFF